MKQFLVASLILLSTATSAGGHGHHGHGHHGWRHNGGSHWVAPLIIGGVVGAIITRETQPTVVQPPVIVQQPQQVYQAPYGYHHENILDANCGCYRLVLIQNR